MDIFWKPVRVMQDTVDAQTHAHRAGQRVDMDIGGTLPVRLAQHVIN
jgi:hypothetical protein